MGTVLFDYFLSKSLNINYDENYLYVEIRRKHFISIPLNKIEEIVHLGNQTFYFISPNPSFFRQKEVKELLNYKKHLQS